MQHWLLASYVSFLFPVAIVSSSYCLFELALGGVGPLLTALLLGNCVFSANVVCVLSKRFADCRPVLTYAAFFRFAVATCLGYLAVPLVFVLVQRQTNATFTAILAAAALLFAVRSILTAIFSVSVLQGTTVLDCDSAVKAAESRIAADDPGIFWGGARLRTDSANTHFLLLGLPGTGKTTCFRFLMEALLPSIRPGSDRRALIFDAKTEVYPQLMALGLECPIRILNPFDARSASWNIAADVTDSTTAFELAAIFVPEEPNANGSSSFFTNAARALLAGVMKSFIKTTPHKWTLADVINTLEDPERLRHILSRSPATQSLVARFLAKDSTFLDVFSTIATKLEHFKAVAAIWKSDASKSFSLRQWMAGEEILILGNDKTRNVTLQPLNRAFFHLVTKLVLNPHQKDSSSRRTYIFLDELPQAGRLDGLSDIQTNGRSYGVSVALGFQSREGLCKPGLYSTEEATEIIEQCNHRAIFRVNDNTAKWAAECVIGSKLCLEESYNQNRGGSGTSHSQQQRLAVLPSDLANLSDLENHQKMHGYYSSAGIGVWTSCLPAKTIFSRLTPPSTYPAHSRYQERSYVYQDEEWLSWDVADEERLGLVPQPTEVEHEPELMRVVS